MALQCCRLGFEPRFRFKMPDDPAYIFNSFSITNEELASNCVDPGIMFCEDCRQWHIIYYRKCIEEEVDGFLRYVLGFYECEKQDREFLWSINGKRVD